MKGPNNEHNGSGYQSRNSAGSHTLGRTILLLVLLSGTLTAPLGFKLANQLLEGQTRPYTLPVWKAIRDRVHQEHGITFLSASRFGIEHKTDVLIVLTAAEAVSAGFISDLKPVANEAQANNLNIGVYVLQQAAIKRSKF